MEGDLVGTGGVVVFGEGLFEGAAAGLGVGVGFRAADEVEVVGGCGGEEVAGGGEGAGGVIDEDGVVAAGRVGVEDDEGDLQAVDGGEESFVGLGDHEGEAIDEADGAAEAAAGGSAGLGVDGEGADEDLVAEPAGFGVGAAEEFGVELTVDVWECDAEEAGATGHQALGEAIGAVVELVDGGLDASGRFGRDEVGFVDGAADGRDGDGGQVGNILDGGFLGGGTAVTVSFHVFSLTRFGRVG